MADQSGPSRDRRPDLRASGGGIHRHLDRLTFLDKVRTLVPESLHDLHDRATSGADESEALDAWATRWNLVDDWVLDVARRTFRIYADPAKHRQKREQYLRIYYDANRELIERGELSMRPPAYGRDDLEPPYDHLQWVGGLRESLSDLSYEAVRDLPLIRRPAAPFEFSASYDPEIDSRDEIRDRLLDEWEAHADAREAQARQDGATDPVRKRARSGEDATLHFAWAARWQVLGESYSEIGDDPGDDVPTTRSPKTVREAVIDVCDRIGLTRRTKIDPPNNLRS